MSWFDYWNPDADTDCERPPDCDICGAEDPRYCNAEKHAQHDWWQEIAEEVADPQADKEAL